MRAAVPQGMRIDAREFDPNQAYSWRPRGLSSEVPEFVPSEFVPVTVSVAADAEVNSETLDAPRESLDQTDSDRGNSGEPLPAAGQPLRPAHGAIPGPHDGPAGLIDALLGEQATYDNISSDEFRVPRPLVDSDDDEEGSLRIEGNRLHWDLPGNDRLQEVSKGECLRSPRFTVAGVPCLQLLFFPRGAALTGKGDCALALHVWPPPLASDFM